MLLMASVFEVQLTVQVSPQISSPHCEEISDKKNRSFRSINLSYIDPTLRTDNLTKRATVMVHCFIYIYS